MAETAAAAATSPASAEKSQTTQTTLDSTLGAAKLEEMRWRPALGLLCPITVDLPLPDFKVADFLNLRVGSVISTGWRLTRDVPLRIHGTLIAWAEFEGAGGRLGVRITEVA
jgi:flagellar motor switch/type III secretory pathway protein FliN